VSRVDENGFAYRTKFGLWETRASVRNAPRRVLHDEARGGKLFFPPELVPMVAHPLVEERGPSVVEELLLQRLHVYLDFTADLEQSAVNPVTQLISRRRIGFALPERMVEDAYKICTDESWHAQFSDDLQRQIAEATGTRPILPAEPQFLARLRAAEESAPPEIAGLPKLFFTIVSETLISSILAGIPADERIVTAVRRLVGDHAQDEGRHHAFFSSVFAYAWPALSVAERRLIGPLLAEFVFAFLEPDYRALRQVVRAAGLTDDEARRVVEETHPPEAVVAGIRLATASTLRLFAEHDVFADPATRAAFAERGLVEDGGEPRIDPAIEVPDARDPQPAE
jgi:hypothetical protein